MVLLFDLSEVRMTLQEVLSMDAATFQKACNAATNTDDLAPINAGARNFEDALKSFENFESTSESILAIHEAGRSCP